MNAAHISLKPRVSEQTFALSEEGTYVFEVPIDATKQAIKAAVEKQFDVGVTSVRTTIQKGKLMPSARKRQQPKYGPRSNVKKAFVNLNKGDKIVMFEGAEK